jgi:hypothetical protein
VNPWCGEKYEQMRLVTFEFERTTHLYIGPPVARVKQTQYCRTESNDKCTMAMALEFDGIPYSDTFGVEVRWVARRVDENDIHVEVGVFVNFKKSSMFASKIKNGTLSETKPVHEKLFECIRVAVAKATGEEAAMAAEEPEAEVAEIEEKKAGLSIEDVVAKAQSVIARTLQGDTTSILVVVASLVLVLKLFKLIFGSRDGTDSAAAIQELTQTVEELRTDISELTTTMSELMTLMQELKANSS